MAFGPGWTPLRHLCLGRRTPQTERYRWVVLSLRLPSLRHFQRPQVWFRLPRLEPHRNVREMDRELVFGVDAETSMSTFLSRAAGPTLMSR